MVIICTDGLANIGLGNLESESQNAIDFYKLISDKAKEVGVSISVITIKGEECKIAVLGKLADETNGSIIRYLNYYLLILGQN